MTVTAPERIVTPFRPAPVLGAVPATLLAPELVHPSDQWVHRCDVVLAANPRLRYRESAGEVPAASLVCGLRTQGGWQGLRAHVRVCHRTT